MPSKQLIWVVWALCVTQTEACWIMFATRFFTCGAFNHTGWENYQHIYFAILGLFNNNLCPCGQWPFKTVVNLETGNQPMTFDSWLIITENTGSKELRCITEHSVAIWSIFIIQSAWHINTPACMPSCLPGIPNGTHHLQMPAKDKTYIIMSGKEREHGKTNGTAPCFEQLATESVVEPF